MPWPFEVIRAQSLPLIPDRRKCLVRRPRVNAFYDVVAIHSELLSRRASRHWTLYGHLSRCHFATIRLNPGTVRCP
ncbi:hypothetical protein C8Q79DRAFT_977718 [Trametes meyenii]|nr:hypothetical protein C8Q79DRAFT_977718 [Trametes meyenii]